MLDDCFFQMNSFGDVLEVIRIPNKYSNTITHYKFNSHDKKTILIGRDYSADIKLDWDKSHSKIQATIYFDPTRTSWILKDGSSKGPSKKGSWLYVSKSYLIKDKAILLVSGSKISMTLMK